VRFLITSILIVLIQVVFAQNSTENDIEKTIAFGKHLVNSNQADEAAYYLNKIDTHQLSSETIDEINYLLGWNFYQQKKLDQSAQSLLKVSLHSTEYHKSWFFAGYNNIYLNRFDSAKIILNKIQVLNQNLYELQQFQLAGIALLERDFDAFENLNQNFSYNYFPITKQEKNFITYHEKMKAYK